MPSYYNNIIESWIDIINNELDLIKLLIYQQSSYVLTIKQLISIDMTALFNILNYESNTTTINRSCFRRTSIFPK